MIKISIIVPVYNIENYLDKCLYSLVHQTLKEIQIIIVNDGSNDNSYKIIEKYKTEYNEKILYIEKKNGGLSDARNAGINYAIGEYIGCVDGDDYVDVTMFEKMYNTAKKENADMVECDYYHVYNKKLEPKLGKIYNLSDILAKARVIAWNKIIKREIIKDSNITYPVGLLYEDIEYFYKIVPNIRKVSFVKEMLYYYVQRKNSICHIYNEKTKDIFIVLNNVIEFYKEKKLYEKYEEQLEYIFIKHLLGGSFIRMTKIIEKKMRKKILNENWKMLLKIFPNWRKNYYLKRGNSKLDFFLKTQNILTYHIYSYLLYLFFK